MASINPERAPLRRVRYFAIAFIFGMKDIEELEEAFEGKLDVLLTEEFK